MIGSVLSSDFSSKQAERDRPNSENLNDGGVQVFNHKGKGRNRNFQNPTPASPNQQKKCSLAIILHVEAARLELLLKNAASGRDRAIFEHRFRSPPR